jgi:hypothetical protein
MKFLILTLVVLSFSSAFAVSDAGTRGGGNALICFNDPAIPAAIRKDNGDIKDEYIPSIKTIQMLDIYETSLQQGMEDVEPVRFMPILKGESIAAFAERMISRIADFTPVIATHALKVMHAMPPNKSFAHPYGIENVRDFDLMGKINSRHCVVGTILYHVKKGGTTEIHYDQRLWNHSSFDAYNKYVAYLHEVIYSSMRESVNAENSDDARKLVGMLLKKNFDQDSFIRFVLDKYRYQYRYESFLNSYDTVVSGEIGAIEIAYGAPVEFIKRTLDPERLSYGVLTYDHFVAKNYATTPFLKEYFFAKDKGYLRDFFASLSPESKRDLNKFLAKDFSKEYKNYLFFFRQNAFISAKEDSQKYMVRLEQATYYSAEQKRMIFSAINAYFDQTPEQHLKAVNSYTDFKRDNQEARNVSKYLFGNVKLKLSNYYPLQGQF